MADLLTTIAAAAPKDAASGFRLTYMQAHAWEDAEKRKDVSVLAGLIFAADPKCFRCGKYCIDPVEGLFKPMQCSKCKAVMYCSRECQIMDWKNPNGRHHKMFCARNKKHMERGLYFRSVLTQFPWARVEIDGSFPLDIMKARWSVLGAGASFGYWSIPGPRGSQVHDTFGSYNPDEDAVYAAKRKTAIPRAVGYVHGEVMLGATWPTDEGAWKLKDENLIPHLFFSEMYPPPKAAERGEVKDWASWYAWRGLGLESPAAHLMDYPLTVYHILTDVIKVANPTASARRRQNLLVHYLGPEVELNLLPLFSELALLLAHTDITIVFFGKAVSDLVSTARQKHPGSLATKDIVWSYFAPEVTGGGSIKIKLHSQSETWTPQAIGPKPDALVGLNAGLLSYSEWCAPTYMSATLEIPFAVTDYSEQLLETCALNVPKQLELDCKLKNGKLADKLLKARPMPITVNPFHRPGQRSMSDQRVPNLYNGFVMPLVMKA
ncbi:hypothetical protein B0H21DRAFT_29837 [Amylocystis lapponica]|nr:hypothetical protein B0H21DRAFT_29837 [Amylocystis lapponica]